MATRAAMVTQPAACLVLLAMPPASNHPAGALGVSILPPVGHIFHLSPAGNVIGRAAPPDATIVLPYFAVSRRHAQIDLRGLGHWEIVDLSSRNGTYVNGQQLQPKLPRILAEGD